MRQGVRFQLIISISIIKGRWGRTGEHYEDLRVWQSPLMKFEALEFHFFFFLRLGLQGVEGTPQNGFRWGGRSMEYMDTTAMVLVEVERLTPRNSTEKRSLVLKDFGQRQEA